MGKRPLVLPVLLILLCTIGCGGSGGGSSQSDSPGITALPALNLKTIDVTTPSLQNVSFDNGAYTGQDLKALTLFSESVETGNGTARATSNDNSARFVDAQKGQIMFLETPAQKAIAVVFVSASEIASGRTAISIDHIADGFIMCNPLMLGYQSADRESLLTLIKSDPLYQELKVEIQNALTVEPDNLMNYAVFPKIYEYSTRLILATDSILRNSTYGPFQQVLPRVSGFLGISIEGVPGPVIGNDTTIPYLGDVPGNDILLVNPTMLFYGVDIDNGKATVLVQGKEQSWGFFNGKFGIYDPVVITYSLGEGIHNIRFTKGFLGGAMADDMAVAANCLKLIQLILDTFAWCPGSNETIANGVNAAVSQDGLDNVFKSWFGNIKDELPEEILKETVSFLHDKNNWSAISKYFYTVAEDKAVAVRFLQQTKQFLSTAATATKIIEIYSLTAETVPFLWDYYTKPWNSNIYYGTQNGGVLTELPGSSIPPKAVAEKIYPQEVYVNDNVIFDASGSSDDHDSYSSLEVRWDFNGDNIFEIDWTTEKKTSTIYTNNGTYTVVVEVRDSDGLTARYLLRVIVKSKGAQGSARHIKVFRDLVAWSPSSAFEDVMVSLGYTKGLGVNQYEFLPSSTMATTGMTMEPGQDFVIIMNDQPQLYYNNLATSFDRFERFVMNGGSMLWESCDLGWNQGSMDDAGLVFPNGVTYLRYFDNMNYVLATDSDLMRGLPQVLYGTYASHRSFSNLPANSKTYLTDSTGKATLLEYSYGRGTIVLSGNPLEYNYDRVLQANNNMGLVYPKLMKYVLGGQVPQAIQQPLVIKEERIINEVPSSLQ